jgi:heavy metal efflux system protein
MFEKLTTLAVTRWPVVLTATLVFCIFGWYRFQALPIEAFPDVTDPMVEIVGLYPGQAAEEVERRVTLELERALAGTPGLIDLRSVSVFGLSLITLTFEEKTPDFQLRTLVAERLRDAELPEGAESIMGPQATPVGQIYRYTLKGARSLRELRAIQDFVIERRLRAVPGVAEVVTFGGFERQYQIRIDQGRMVAAGVSIEELYEAVKRSNENAGGGYVGVGSQELIVRGLGALKDPRDLGWAVVKASDGVPIRVRDVADVVEGSTPRRGSVGRGHNDEVVEGIVLLRRGENPSVVLDALHERIKLLNDDILPKDVRISTFYDRTTLVGATLSTVGKNLLEGALLVLAVVYLFLRTVRAMVIVAVVLPVSMLTAFVGLHALGLPANLISLGAIDFGILVDGAIIVVEATLHALEKSRAGDRSELLQRAAASVAKPVGFAMLIIIVALGPIFSLERVEGRIFAPMAYTYAFALLGALACAMLVVPALESVLMRGDFHVEEPRWLIKLGEVYGKVLERLDRIRVLVFALFLGSVLALGMLGTRIGTEFLPELNEGGFYITAVFPSTISLDETRKNVRQLRAHLLKTPEVRDVLSHVGRPEDATQAEGPNNAELFVVLAPETEWREGKTRSELEREMRGRLSELPGVQYNFSQPITDRVFETISGIIGQVVVKVRGENLVEMTAVAEQVRERLAKVRGVADLALYQAGSIPSLAIELDRDALARRGLSVEDVQRTVRIAMGGEVATEVWQGERRFAATLRLPDGVRANPDTLGRLVVGDPTARATLGEVAHIAVTEGRSSIWREDFTRFVALKFNVRGRDLGSTVDDARKAVADLKIAEGMYLTWGGEFQNQNRAMKRLAITLPLSLIAIVGILFMNFRRWRPTLMIVAFLPVAIVGAVAGLQILGENFSVSSAVGCIALLGQVVLSGVILCSRTDEARLHDPETAFIKGAKEAFRPVMLTTALALLGLIPAATSHAMGSETQRPFAIAIVAGLFLATPALLFVLPLLYKGRANRGAPLAPVVLGLWALLATAPVGAQTTDVSRVTWPQAAEMVRKAAPDVLLSRAEVDVAEAQVDVAQALPNPEISYVGYARTTGNNAAINGTQHQAQVEQPLLVFGQRGARRSYARSLSKLAGERVAVTQQEALRRARHAFVELQTSQRAVELLTQYQDQLTSIFDVVSKRAAAGSQSAYDALRVEVEVAQLSSRLEQAQATERAASVALALELGRKGWFPRAEGELGFSRILSTRWEDVQKSLPSLRAAEQEVRAAQASIELARAERRPIPALTAGGYWTTDGKSSSVVFGAALPLPVWNTGKASIRAAETTQKAAELARTIVETQSETRLIGALQLFESTREAFAIYERGTLEKLPRLCSMADAAYKAGAASVLVLLDANRSANDIELGRLAVLENVMHAEVEVLAASGSL